MVYNGSGGGGARGSGDNLNQFPLAAPQATVGQLEALTLGGQAAPDASPHPALKASRTINLQNAQVPGDGAEEAAAIAGIATDSPLNQVQPIGVWGGSEGTGPQVGLYGSAIQTNAGAGGAAVGMYAKGLAQAAGGRSQGIQLTAYNNTGTDHNYNDAGGPFTVGAFVYPSGANKVAAAILITSPTGTPQFDAGIYFPAAGGGPTLTADMVSNSHANTSILITGPRSGTQSAIAVVGGAGGISIGSPAIQASGALLSVVGSTSALRPIMTIGNAGQNQSYSAYLQNSAGRHEIAVGSGALLTGGAAAGGDAFWIAPAAKAFHVGGTISTVAVNGANQLMFFNSGSFVSRQTMGVATAAATYGANEQTMLQAVYNAVRNVGLGT
jgi:hypothetical protein